MPTELSEKPNNKLAERELKKTILFTTASKRVKYLGIKLPRRSKTYTRNYLTLMKESENTNKWKEKSYS